MGSNISSTMTNYVSEQTWKSYFPNTTQTTAGFFSAVANSVSSDDDDSSVHLDGYLSDTEILESELSGDQSVSGELMEKPIFSIYSGSYSVTPSVSEQVLDTMDKIMTDDLVIQKVPYWETSNTQGGLTIYIAGEVE